MQASAISKLLIFVLLMFSWVAVSPAANEKKVIVCSTTQVADFARQVVGDRWEVKCVLGAGEDPHTYEIGADDKIVISKADLCVENGWNLEGHDWMRKLAQEAGKPLVTCVNGIEPLIMEDKGQSVKDPHAWFSPRNAIVYVKNIEAAVSEIDPLNSAEYSMRTELYVRQLSILNGWIQKTVSAIPANRRLLVTHHDAFGYFCTSFNFKSVSPVGWTTAELTEVTAQERQLVVNKIREIGVKAVFVETSTNKDLIDGIARDAGVVVGGKLYSDAMGPDGTAGDSYIGMMRENVLTIVNALK